MVNKSWIIWGTVAWSVILAYLLVNPNNFPHLGITLTLISMVAVAYYAKPKPQFLDPVYVLLSLILASFITLRVNIFLTFLNFVAVLGIGSLIVLNFSIIHHFSSVMVSIINAVVKIFASKSNMLSPVERNSSLTKKRITELTSGIIAALVILILVIPALTSANPLFNQWLQNILPTLSENMVLNGFRVAVFTLLLWLFSRLRNAVLIESKEDFYLRFSSVAWWLPKGVLIVVLIIFFISQGQLYSMDNSQLLAAGITHSQRTQEIFGQLAWVSLLTLSLVGIDLKTKKYPSLNLILLLEALILTVIALISDLSYIQAWGLTHKRLYGLTIIFWLWGICLLVGLSLKISKLQPHLIERSVIFSALVLVGVNLLNFDYLIAHATVLKTHQGIDYEYLANLSSDSRNGHKLLQNLTNLISPLNPNQIPVNLYNAYNRNVFHLSWLQQKYQHFDLRNLNLSEYWQYRQIKDLNLKPHLDRLSNLNPI